MKSFALHAAVLAAASIVACKTGGAPAGKAGVSMDPGAKVAEVDGQPITYGDLLTDKDVGPKIRQAEVKALTDLYDQRRGLLDELISRRLLESEAKSAGKTLEQWFQTDYVNMVPEPTDAEAKAFFDEHKAQIPAGQSFDELKPRIKQAVKQQKLRDNMGKMLEGLKQTHHVNVALEPPELRAAVAARLQPLAARGARDAG